jgi:Gpi18-like mannosyltransferase
MSMSINKENPGLLDMISLSLKKILIIAFLLRIIMALLGEHGDVINYMWWSKDLVENGLRGFYDRSIANAMPPTYPPITSYIFWMTGYLHKVLWNIIWFLNLKISIFPSNLIFWLESDKGWYFVNKLPSIFADVGIIAFMYKLVTSIKGKKEAVFCAALFAFNPVFWYNSSLWGQTDSIFALFLIASFYFLHKKKRNISLILYLLSILTKPTAFFVAPVFLIFWIKNLRAAQLVKSVFLVLTATFLLYFPFKPVNTIYWIVDFYVNSLGGELDYIVANSFNLWGLVFGFENVSVNTKILGISSSALGYLLFILSTTYVFFVWRFKKYKTETVLLMSAIVSFLAFAFLPMMHERYFYPVLLLLTPLAAVEKRVRNIYLLLSLIHLINLYHFWWVPRIPFLVELLSIVIVEKIIIIINFWLFYRLLRYYRIHYVEK